MKIRTQISEQWTPLAIEARKSRHGRAALIVALSICWAASSISAHASPLKAYAPMDSERQYFDTEGREGEGNMNVSPRADQGVSGGTRCVNEFASPYAFGKPFRRCDSATDPKGELTALLMTRGTADDVQLVADARPTPEQSTNSIKAKAVVRWGKQKESARFFVSGHSLTDDPYASNIADIARSLIGPQAAKFNEQIVIGSPIRVRTGAPKNVAGYSVGKNWPEGEGMDVRKELRSGATINGDRYDTLVITENHNLIQNMQWEGTVKQTRHFHEQLIAGNSSANTFLHASWWDVDKGSPKGWIDAERALAPVWQCVSSRINQSLVAEGRKDRVWPLPTSLALTYLVEGALNGEIEGISGGSPKATLNKIFSDNVHLTPLGSYYMSLVTFAAIYQRSPQGAPPAQGVSKEQAATLQTLAWKFVSNFYAAYEDPSLTDCNNRWAPAACVRYWTERKEPGAIRECKAMFQAANPDNPFFYNPQTDASFWYSSKP